MAKSVDSGSRVSAIKVRVGSTYRKSHGTVIPVVTIIIHGDYNASADAFDYDFALLKLYEPIHIDNVTTKAIALADPTDHTDWNSKCSVTGWGLTDELNERSVPRKLKGVQVSIISNSVCQNMYRKLKLTDGITDRMICTASETGDQNCRSLLKCEPEFELNNLLIFCFVHSLHR